MLSRIFNRPEEAIDGKEGSATYLAYEIHIELRRGRKSLAGAKGKKHE